MTASLVQDRFAAVAAGRHQPSNSRSRTSCSRSGSHRLVPAPAGYRGAADIAGDRGGGRSPHSTHFKPRHGQVERLLLLGSTGHCRPIAVVRPVFLNDHKVQETEVRGGRQRATPQRLLPVAASPRTHRLEHLAVVRARTGLRNHRRSCPSAWNASASPGGLKCAVLSSAQQARQGAASVGACTSHNPSVRDSTTCSMHRHHATRLA